MFELLNGFQVGMPVAKIEDFVGIVGSILAVFGIPTIAILTHHQRKMAEIIHRNQPQQVDPDVQQQLNVMQAQMADMRSMMQEHIIKSDRASTSSVEQRLHQ